MTMLERMAGAFAAHVRANAHGDWIGGDARCLEVDGTIDLPDALRAALLAIREPDEAMVAAAEELEPQTGWWPDEPGERNTPAQHFTAMIDAILRDDEP